MKISVSWLKDLVSLRPPIEGIADKLTLAGLEVKSVKPSADKKDALFEIEITSNRPDWLSHLGVAREVAAVESLGVKLPEIDTHDSHQTAAGWKIQLRELKACPYYSGVLIEGIEMAATPDFMRERLEACGLRPINLIVDITNYVLLETGQPLHAFDADLLKGKEIQVRFARPKEKFTAINGTAYELDAHDLVIGDAHNAAALAGVMGGKDTEVSARSRNIFLESAYFLPQAVRQSSRRHALQSDSSYRFERRVDPECVDFARQRALFLIRKYAKPRFISTVLKAGDVPKPAVTYIHLTAQEIRRVLGADIKAHTVNSVLNRLGLEAKQKSQEVWDVSIPSFRSDLLTPVDLIEEIARIYGYDQIPAVLPVRAPVPYEPNLLLKAEGKLRDFLAASGLFETITFSLIGNTGLSDEDLKNAVQLVNPMHKDMRWMRPFMVPSLLNVVRKNFDQGAQRVPVFEIANVYRMAADNKKTEESKTACVVLSGKYRPKTWMDPEREVTFFDLKGLIESACDVLGVKDVVFDSAEHSLLEPGTAQIIKSGDAVLGVLGQVKTVLAVSWDIEAPVYAAEINLESLTSIQEKVKSYQPMPRYPAMTRDLAVAVPESVHAGEIKKQILKRGDGLIRSVEVFDVFRGGRIPKGYKNIAYRVIYQSSEKTLVSDDIQKIHTAIADEISRQFQATFQS